MVDEVEILSSVALLQDQEVWGSPKVEEDLVVTAVGVVLHTVKGDKDYTDFEEVEDLPHDWVLDA